MRLQRNACQFSDTDPLVVVGFVVNMANYGRPNKSPRCDFGSSWFAPDSERRADSCIHPSLVASNDNHCRCSVTRNEGPRSICDQPQILARQKFLDQGNAKLTLHEGV